MAKHIIWTLVLIAPCAGLLSESLLQKFPKFRLRHLLLIILIFNLLYLGIPKEVSPTNAHFYGQSSFGQLVDYKSNIPKDALVIADSRIYRGNIHFGLAGTNYIEAAQFLQIIQELNAKGNLKNTDVYYVECAIDDCGWGTIKDQPDFNASMEQLTEIFSNISYSKIDFVAPDPYKYYLPFSSNKRTDYRVYKAQVAMNPLIFQVSKQTHVWFLYPIGYDRTISEIFDDYYTYTPLDNLLNKTASLILYLEIILSILALIYVLYLFIGE
jgi:hypothetical protein